MRAQARREGRSLSEWLREAGIRLLGAVQPAPLDSVDSLHAFFAECDEREATREPDWEQHLAVMARSRAGQPPESPV